MPMRTLLAATMPEAMARVRATYGEDAVILASRQSPAGVIVMVDAGDPVEPPPAIDTAAPDAPAPARERHEPARHGRGTGTGRGAEQIAGALDFHRVPQNLAERLLAVARRVPDEPPELSLAAAFEHALTFQPLKPERLARPLLLAGPPGGGKTVTCVKLAARAAMAGRAVVIVDADRETTGAAARLSALAEPLGIDILPLASLDELRDVQAALPADTAVIVDSTALSPFEPEALADLAALATGFEADIALCLPATMAVEEAAEIAQLLRAIGCERLIPTQLDQAQRIGAVLAAAAAGLSLCLAGTGRSLGTGLNTLTPGGMARVMLHNARRPGGRPDPLSGEDEG